jgi:hypothetical protein
MRGREEETNLVKNTSRRQPKSNRYANETVHRPFQPPTIQREKYLRQIFFLSTSEHHSHLSRRRKEEGERREGKGRKRGDVRKRLLQNLIEVRPHRSYTPLLKTGKGRVGAKGGRVGGGRRRGGEETRGGGVVVPAAVELSGPAKGGVNKGQVQTIQHSVLRERERERERERGREKMCGQVLGIVKGNQPSSPTPPSFHSSTPPTTQHTPPSASTKTTTHMSPPPLRRECRERVMQRADGGGGVCKAGR